MAGNLVDRFDYEDGVRKAVRNGGGGYVAGGWKYRTIWMKRQSARDRRHGAIRRRCLRIHHHHKAAAGGSSHSLVVRDGGGLRPRGPSRTARTDEVAKLRIRRRNDRWVRGVLWVTTDWQGLKESVAIHERQEPDEEAPAANGLSAICGRGNLRRRRKGVIKRGGVVLNCQPDLHCVALARGSSSGLTGQIDGGNEQSQYDRKDRRHNEQFPETELKPAAVECRCGGLGFGRGHGLGDADFRFGGLRSVYALHGTLPSGSHGQAGHRWLWARGACESGIPRHETAGLTNSILSTTID